MCLGEPDKRRAGQVGPRTEAIAAEGHIVTAGGVETNIRVQHSGIHTCTRGHDADPHAHTRRCQTHSHTFLSFLDKLAHVLETRGVFG